MRVLTQRFSVSFFAVCLLCLSWLPGQSLAQQNPPTVGMLHMHNTLQSESASVLADALKRAASEHDSALIIAMTSPGGTSEATDQMVASIRNSPVPVIFWVDESHSRVSGQALRLLAASDRAYMMDGSYITPLWTDIPRKLTPVEKAAGTHRMTQQLAEAFAADGRSLSPVDELAGGIHWFNAQEAKQAGIVDGIVDHATDIFTLATQQGYKRNGIHYPLHLENARLVEYSQSPQTETLLALMNPNLCVLLFSLGVLLIYLEINTPGVIIPGLAGISLVLIVMYSLSRMPLNHLAVAGCIFGLLMLLLEARFPMRGAFAIIGILALIFGLAYLVRGSIPQLEVSWSTAIGAGIGFGGLTGALLVFGAEARRSKLHTGSDALLGWLAIAQTPLAPEGQVLVRGELWKARLTTKDSAVPLGGRVKVLRADGDMLEVTAIPMAES